MNPEKIDKAFWCIKIFTNKDVLTSLTLVHENPGATVTELNRLAYHDDRYKGKGTHIEKHLSDLRKYGYVRYIKDGKWRKYFANLDRVYQVGRAIHNFTYGMTNDICKNAPFEIVTV